MKVSKYFESLDGLMQMQYTFNPKHRIPPLAMFQGTLFKVEFRIESVLNIIKLINVIYSQSRRTQIEVGADDAIDENQGRSPKIIWL